MIRVRHTCCYAVNKVSVVVVPSIRVSPGRHPGGDPHPGNSAHRQTTVLTFYFTCCPITRDVGQVTAGYGINYLPVVVTVHQ